MKNYYYPRELAKQKAWLKNYRDFISTHGPTLGMTPTEVQDNIDAADRQIAKVEAAITAENAFKSAVDARDNGAKVDVKLITDTTKRNKTSSAYTTEIGDILGIEGEESVFDAANYKPKGSAKAVLGDVTIKFTLKGAEGMAIYSRVITGAAATNPLPPQPAEPPKTAEIADFKKIGVDYHSPYVDNRPLTVAGQPEIREYFMRGVVNDVEIGLPSDVIRVAVGMV